MEPAFQITIEDPSMRAYLQRYPFAEGPYEPMNRLCREALADGVSVRPAHPSAQVHRLRVDEGRLAPEAMVRLLVLFDQAQMAAERRAGLLDDFAWEASLLPVDATDVLVLGCGDGSELLFLRAVLSAARITALDYVDKLTPEIRRAVDVHFVEGDMTLSLTELEASGRHFDLVTSNHTLEHLYDPASMLAQLVRLLQPSGALLSTLPMDAAAGTPFLDRVAAFTEPGRQHPLDVVCLDAGHPWKTNAGDLKGTLLEAGFRGVDLYQRAWHLSRFVAADAESLAARRGSALKQNERWFGALRGMLKRMFPQELPPGIFRLLLAVERRTPFGTNRLKNRLAEEVCVVARR